MDITDPVLGMFSFLPAEVRKMIWKHLSPQLHVNRSRPRKPNHHLPYQGILLTSREISVEVAAEVPSGYSDNTIEISVPPAYRYKSWIMARNTKGVQWDLEDPADAISRGFCDLPWHNLNVKVWIWAPNRKDRGKIICLCKKIRGLVEILKGAKGFLSLCVVFGHTKNTSWFDGAWSRCSITNMADLLPERWGPEGPAKWNYDYVFPLFLQLRNVKMARMYSTEIFEGKRENRLMVEKFMKAERIMRRTTPYGSRVENQYHDEQIQWHLWSLSLIVERVLDHLPTETANMLRLDRFSSWYTDKLHGNSPYENELKKLLLNYVDGPDTLNRMNVRYRMMRAHNPLSLAYRTAFPETFNSAKDPDIDARGWNRDA